MVPGREIEQLTRCSEAFVAKFEQIDTWSVRGAARQHELLAVRFLEAVSEHGAVDLGEDVAPDLDLEVRPDSQDVAVEGGVVDLAEGQSVGHFRDAQCFAVTDDVRRVEELAVLQAADGACMSIGPHHTVPERSLVESLQRQAAGVDAVKPSLLLAERGGPQVDAGRGRVVQLDVDGERLRVVLDDEGWPEGSVVALVDPHEVDERQVRRKSSRRPALKWLFGSVPW